MNKLLDGNKRFFSGRLRPKDMEQHPSAIVVTCSDSMTAPEVIFNQGPGNLFVIRISGNVLDPASVGSIEYAARQYQPPLLIILGHDKCDIVKSAFELKDITQDNTTVLFRKIMPAIKKATAAGGSQKDIFNNAIRENVLIQQKYLLRKSPVISGMVSSGALKIVTAIYHDETGQVELFGTRDSKQ